MVVGEMRQPEATQTAKGKESNVSHKKNQESHKNTCLPSQNTNCVLEAYSTYSSLLLTHERIFHLHFSILLQPPHHQTRNKIHFSKIIGSPQPTLSEPTSQESHSDHRGLLPPTLTLLPVAGQADVTKSH